MSKAPQDTLVPHGYKAGEVVYIPCFSGCGDDDKSPTFAAVEPAAFIVTGIKDGEMVLEMRLKK